MKSASKLSLGFATGFLTCALLGGTAAFAASGIFAEKSTCQVFVNGQEAKMEAYVIEGHNYLKLRDVGELVGFNVWWDGSVQIDSGAPYTGEAPQQSDPQPMVPKENLCNQANPNIFTGVYTREAYNALREVVAGAERSSAVILSEETQQAMEKAAAAVGMWPGYHLTRVTDELTCFTASYSSSYQEAANACQPFVDGLAGKAVTEKIREIAAYVCDRLSYDAASTSTPRTALTTTGVSKGNCMSYAHNFKFLCDMAGIPCVFVHSENHQWNEVLANGVWYAVDLTSYDISYTSGDPGTLLIDRDTLKWNPYRQTEPELTLFAKELVAPGSTQ